LTARPFPYLLLPVWWASRNRARNREPGDTARAALFGGIAVLVAASIFIAVFWLSVKLLEYEELGDYLIRLGLSWLFLTFLSFLAFSAIVTALSTFFLSEDLRLLLATPVSRDRLFYSRYAKTLGQASWMVVTFLIPVLLAVGLARCAGIGYYAAAVTTLVPFVMIPIGFGSMITLGLVNVFPARRARDILALMGLLFAIALVVMLRFLQPERLMRTEALPDITGFFATLQSPVTPFLPSFWAGETLFAALTGRMDWLHAGALWTTALASMVLARMAFGRLYFEGWSKSQEARKARFTRFAFLDRIGRWLPARSPLRHLFVKDLKVFLRDTTQWSQLLLLVALVFVYLYNFRVLDLDRLPYMTAVIKNVYAFVNLAMAAFVLSAVAVRFVFPAVSAEGPAFWLIRTSPIPMRAFLWSKFWIGLVPVLVLAEALTIVSNEFLGAAPFLKVVAAVVIVFMTFALVGLATGMGAIYPRFAAENVTQVAGSYGGVAFMVAAVFFTVVEIVLAAYPSFVYLAHTTQHVPISSLRWVSMAVSFAAAGALSLATCRIAMARGISALQALGD
jgi:ABC-2 type transport system permease protein